MPERIVEIWVRMYEEQIRHARHHESLRAQSTNLIVAVSAAILAFLSSKTRSTPTHHALGVLLIAINIYGLMLSLKHYERSRLHASVASHYRDAISAVTSLGGKTIDDARTAAHKAHYRRFRIIRAIPAYVLWSGLHLAVALMGILILILQ